jgi:hypothetical protein
MKKLSRYIGSRRNEKALTKWAIKEPEKIKLQNKLVPGESLRKWS